MELFNENDMMGFYSTMW